MKIKQAEFVGVFVDMNQLPTDQLPEVAIVGRSNVGKSSLINRLANRKNLAKSSSTPGKTRTINFYCFNRSWYLVDLPGYGFAKVSRREKARWGKMIEKYLSGRKTLRGVILLVDIRHSPSVDDRTMKDWLEHHQIPFMVVATKADKLSRSARQKNLAMIRRELQLPMEQPPLGFSAVSGEGLEELLQALQEITESEPIPPSLS
ncbi:MAG: YihA family ribosome biogenesis GTP-binding protein [Syntrophomonadaceae bacterium]|jgi:GTP-binding protein|nr:YihA family ribosome biogenesis GTP-binding protein [Syntrophomonadaceae bacterium]HQA50092.1 ribosome biogenesis GTP-binding protein YihA/YsxC [Syntrophomonadaceae bacterium]HQD91277.1 ribosome biogenesis GTP-binding protein YihA/YsxC [Syntrophomonadaceae bacterium]